MVWLQTHAVNRAHNCAKSAIELAVEERVVVYTCVVLAALGWFGELGSCQCGIDFFGGLTWLAQLAGTIMHDVF